MSDRDDKITDLTKVVDDVSAELLKLRQALKESEKTVHDRDLEIEELKLLLAQKVSFLSNVALSCNGYDITYVYCI